MELACHSGELSSGVPEASKVTKLSDWQQKFAQFTEEQLGHLASARHPEKVN